MGEKDRLVKRTMQSESLKRWETAWRRESKTIRQGEEGQSAETKAYLTEKVCEKIKRWEKEKKWRGQSDALKLKFEKWNEEWERQETKREEEEERAKVEAEELRQWTESLIAKGHWDQAL